MTQIISNSNWWWGWASYTAWTWIDISVDKEISIDTDVVQTVDNMVENLDNADNTHYPTAQAVKEAISASWGWDVTWPASSTDWNVVLFDWTTWKIIKDSWVNLSSKLDASAMSNNNYGWAWQGDSTHTPTKWVLYDKIHTMDVEIGNKAADNTVVKLTWNQTINGTKTFWTSPVVPSKTTDATNTWTAIATEAQVYNVQQDVDAIDDLIPTEATSSNKLADKNYVNDSINSVTAYYITKNAAGDQWATYAELAAATTFYSGWVQRTPTRNDYTIVLADENHDNATTRYIYNSGWEYQYTVNETALTQAQLDALNSGITSWKVSTYDWYASTIAWKQDTLTTQTAYTTKWTSTKVPTITTNTLWQVTEITETNIDYPVDSVNGQTWDVVVNDVKSSSSAPVSPTKWMVWYDTANDVLKSYDGSNWNEVWWWGGFTPENVGNTWDKLEKTPSGYQWVDWELVEIKADDYSAMRWPCDEWFHVPTKDEWQGLIDAGITDWAWTASWWDDFKTYLKLPYNWSRIQSDWSVQNQGSYWYYWASTTTSTKAYRIFEGSWLLSLEWNRRASWYWIRPFKDTPVVPDGWWTALYSDKIYHNSTLWLISVKNWDSWITIADKNLWAVNVNDYWNYYQRWNNYWFANTWAITTSSTQVDASSYWPGNYYSSLTFITAGNADWSSVQNDNLRWWETWILNSKYAWWEKIAEVPSIWAEWQVLTKTNTGYEWKTKQYTIAITLTSAWWSSNTQTVTATWVTATNNVIVSPEPSSFDDYTWATIYCSAQSTDSLTFTCASEPSNDITVNVMIFS